MKLNYVKPVIESSGEMNDKFFSIHDLGMVFDILRNKMYSNPIQAICREISCNARDSHREVNIADQPIQITLPNYLESFFKVKDFGVGISPNRMEDVFIKYTASTKRNDNVQVGAFGLGGKTPFSYSDTFTIETIFNGVKYNYVCFIDETNVGKLNLLSKEITDQHNGTEIIIPVKHQDFEAFNKSTEFVTRHWEVKPIIKGIQNFKFNEIHPILKGEGWCTVKNFDYNKNIKLIIDGIEYPLDIDQLDQSVKNIFSYISGELYLYFNTGDLSLQTSREAIHLDKPTKEKILSKIKLLYADLKNIIQTNINEFSNFWDASVYYNTELIKILYKPSYFGPFKWKDKLLIESALRIDNCYIHNFEKRSIKRKNVNSIKTYKSSVRYINFIPNTEVYINDIGLKDISNKIINHLLNDKIKTIYVITPNLDVKTEDIISKYQDVLNIKKLSEFTKNIKNRKVSAERLLFFKFNKNNKKFNLISYDSIKKDSNKKIICCLRKDISDLRLITCKHLDQWKLEMLTEYFPDCSFYGVDDIISEERINKSLPGFKSIDSFIKENIIDNKSINFIYIKNVKNMKESSFSISRLERLFTDKSKIKNPNSLSIKYYNLTNKFEGCLEKEYFLLSIYESVFGAISDKELNKFIKNNPELDLKKIEDDFSKKYPLLLRLDTYSKDLAEYVAQYINLVDAGEK